MGEGVRRHFLTGGTSCSETEEAGSLGYRSARRAFRVVDS